MPDDLRSPIKHHLVLHRIDPERRVARFYSLMIERDLFGTVRLVRYWGRIGTNGQELAEIFASEGIGICNAYEKPCPLRGRASFSSPSEPSENRTSSAHWHLPCQIHKLLIPR